MSNYRAKNERIRAYIGNSDYVTDNNLVFFFFLVFVEFSIYMDKILPTSD